MYVQDDLVAKLLEFMVAPHATTDVLLAEKDQVCPGLVVLGKLFCPRVYVHVFSVVPVK